MMQQTKNRWLIVLAAIGIHISIGSVYAWSVLTKPIMQAMGFSLKEVTWTFSLAILFLGTSAGFLGTYVEKYGPRRSGLISMCFFVSGLLGTAYALTQHSLLLLYLFYGVIGGIGLGTGYITPVSTLVKWFPNNRGLATGLAIMGFGFASLVAGPLMQILIAKYGLVENFVILACIYAVVMTASALYLEPPKQETAAGKGQFKAKMPEHVQYTVKEAMHTWQFYALWWIFFTNITCGIGLLAVASPMAQEVIGMSPIAAASMVGIIGLLNGGGRIVWSTISDYIGRANTYLAFFVIEIVAFYLLGTRRPRSADSGARASYWPTGRWCHTYARLHSHAPRRYSSRSDQCHGRDTAPRWRERNPPAPARRRYVRNRAHSSGIQAYAHRTRLCRVRGRSRHCLRPASRRAPPRSSCLRS